MDKPLATHVIHFGDGRQKLGCDIMAAATAAAQSNLMMNMGILEIRYLKTHRNETGFVVCQAAMRQRKIDNNDMRTLYVLPRWEEPTLGFRPHEEYESFSVMSGVQAGIDADKVMEQKTVRVIEDVVYLAESAGEKLGVPKASTNWNHLLTCGLCLSPIIMRGEAHLQACPEHGTDAPRYMMRIPTTD